MRRCRGFRYKDRLDPAAFILIQISPPEALSFLLTKKFLASGGDISVKMKDRDQGHGMGQSEEFSAIGHGVAGADQHNFARCIRNAEDQHF